MSVNIACLSYKVYDRFKQTWLASKLFYHGDRCRRYKETTLTGTTVDCAHGAQDGDSVFDITVGSARWHCEVTSCQPSELRALAVSLKVGTLVKVTGSEFYDGRHFGNPGHWEIHPVTKIEIL